MDIKEVAAEVMKFWKGNRKNLIITDRTESLLRWKTKEEARKGKPMDPVKWNRNWNDRFTIGEYVNCGLPMNMIMGHGDSWEAAIENAKQYVEKYK